MKLAPVLPDATATADGDLLHFERYVRPLVSILTDPDTVTPFTIGVFGPWGSGKSTLLGLVAKRLQDKHPEEFVCVQFNPWIHRGEPNVLVPLLHTLQDTLVEDPKNRFVESAKRIGEVLLRLGADILLKNLTADAASLEKLEKLEETYLKERGRVQSEMRKLRGTMQTLVDTLAKDGARLVLFIDDLDRCEPGDIVGLLESVKLFLDLRHVFVILAVDKEVIDRGIQIKYKDFEFAKERAPAIGAEYLEKMIQLPLYLFPLHPSQIRDFVQQLRPDLEGDPLDLVASLFLPNPRKIKRVLNLLTVTSAMLEGQDALKDLRLDLLTRMIVLQVQSAELYAEVARQPDLLHALEMVYSGEWNVDNAELFKGFGTRRERIVGLCKVHHQPDSFLGRLFQGKPFAPASKEQLSAHLSLLGG